MKVAVVHGLLRGGAARRLVGTVGAMAGLADLELREFALAGSTVMLPAAVQQQSWTPEAPAKPRALRPLWRYRDALGARRAWAELWDAVNDWGADVVFANPCALPGGAPPMLAASRAPVLYYCDEPRRVDYEKDAARASNPLTRLPYLPMRRLQRHDERAAVDAASALATNSIFTAARIRAAYARDAEVITPGIAEVFGGTRAGLVPFEARRHVLSVGTLIPSKGHDLVIAAVAAAGLGLPVVVIGPREDPDESRRLRELAYRLDVAVSIQVGITDDELASLYRSALVTMYLAREEPLGLVSFESQACGTPMIVANDGGLVETVDDGVSGFHVARTSAAAGEALRRMADPGIWAGLAHAAVGRTVPRDRDSAATVGGRAPAPPGDRTAYAARRCTRPGHQPGVELTTSTDMASCSPKDSD